MRIHNSQDPPCVLSVAERLQSHHVFRLNDEDVCGIILVAAAGSDASSLAHDGFFSSRRYWSRAGSIQFNSIQFICIAQFHKLQICLGVLYNLYT